MTHPISPSPGRHSRVNGWAATDQATPFTARQPTGAGDGTWWERPGATPPGGDRHAAAPQYPGPAWQAPSAAPLAPPDQPGDPSYGRIPPHTPPAPPAGPEQPEQEDTSWVDLRNLIAHRLKSINSTHCHEAYDRLGKRGALSQHGVVLFYSLPDRSQPSGIKLHFVTRFFLAGPESENLPAMLDDLTRSAVNNMRRAESSRRRWDPRGPEDSMVNGGDMDMPRHAAYVGAGISTLDMAEVTWRDSVRSLHNQGITGVGRARTVFDLAGRGLAMLIDGTALLAVRDPNRPIGDDGVRSNRNLDPRRTYFFQHNQDLTTQGDPMIVDTWAKLAALHHTLQNYLVPRKPM